MTTSAAEFESAHVSDRDDDISLSVILHSVRRNLRTLSVITAGCLLMGGLIGWLQVPVYRAKVVFALVQPPFSDQSDLLSDASSLGAIGRLAGLNLSSGGSDLAINVEILKSADLAYQFVEFYRLTEKIGANRAAWRFVPSQSRDVSTRRIAEYFQNKVRMIKPSTTPGIYHLEILWKSAEDSASWANGFVEFANSRLRADAAARGERRLEFLRTRLENEPIAQLRDSMSRLITEELKTLALTADVDAYAFRVIDPAVVPVTPTKPRRLLILFLAAVSGAILGIAFILARDSMRGLLHARHN